MDKRIILTDKQGQPLKSVNIHFKGDTLEELDRSLRKFSNDADKWVASAEIAVKDGTTADGRAKSLIGSAAMQVAEHRLKKILDDTFGKEVYPAFFEIRKPFASVGGNFYCQQVFNVLHAEILELIGGLVKDE
jgi:hypothetical protein